MAKTENKNPSTSSGRTASDEPPVTDPRRCAVKVQAAVLHAALKDVIGVISGANTIPVLNNVLFAAGDGQISLSVTDLDIWATRCLPADGDTAWAKSVRGFTTTLPAKSLLALLGEIDGAAMVEIELPLGENPLSAISGRATITAGRSTFRLPVLPAGDFPSLPLFVPSAAFEIAAAQLGDAFAAVEHAISSEETRYYLNGIYLHPHDLDLRMATTDGHRLARLTLDAPDGAASFPGVIIARKTVGILDKLLAAQAKADSDSKASPEMVLVEACGSSTAKLRFVIGDTEIFAKTIDGKFPDYSRVIPTELPNVATIARAALAAAVRRVAVLSARESRAVRATFGDGTISLLVSSPENGEAVEEVPCDYAGPEVMIGFNHKFWLDALAAIGGDAVEMGFSDAIGPVTLRGGEVPGGDRERFVQVLMPVRV